MEFSGQYLTYNEYKTLGGTLNHTPFNLLEFEARKEIDKRTLGRLINLKEQKQNTKICVFQLMNLFTSINNGVETSGNVINYNNDEINKVINDIIVKNLSDETLENGTPYLYCGI